MDYSIKVNQVVPLTLFESKEVKESYLQAVSGMGIGILKKQRYDEIVKFLHIENNINDNLSFKNISELFKIFFFKSIANEAINIAFSKEGKTDILKIIKELITTKTYSKAILGEPMIEAFEHAIKNSKKDNENCLDSCLRGSKIFLLRQYFLKEQN